MDITLKERPADKSSTNGKTTTEKPRSFMGAFAGNGHSGIVNRSSADSTNKPNNQK